VNVVQQIIVNQDSWVYISYYIVPKPQLVNVRIVSIGTGVNVH